MKILTEARKKKKQPFTSCTITTGNPELNIQHFNKCMGTDGGPLSEDLNQDLNVYLPTEEDFKTLSRRCKVYLKFGKDNLPDDQMICDPWAIAITTRLKPTVLIRYWVTATLLKWNHLTEILLVFVKKQFTKEEVRIILDFLQTKTAQLADWAAKYRVLPLQAAQESLNNSENQKEAENKSELATDNKSQNLTLNEAKRYVRRYYIRPQNVFCSNKTDVIQALIQFEDQDCTIYTLNNLSDEKDVTKLTNKDIIYYYDDGILYDKNRVRIMDYDLAIKHEEERPNVDIDQTSDATLSKVYNDRITGLSDTDEAFNLHFDNINAYGETLHEGKIINGTCCICGEPIEGYGNNPEPYMSGEDGARCCDACNLKYVIPARLEQYTEETNNED